MPAQSPRTRALRRLAASVIAIATALAVLASPAGADEVPASPEPLAAWFAALDATASNAADVVFLGDSVSGGYGAPTRADWFLETVRDELQASFGGTGSGYRAAWPTFWTGDDDAWTITGGRDDVTAGLGLRGRLLDSAGAELAITVHADSFRLLYAAGPGRGLLEITVDGTAVARIDTAGAATTTGQAWSSGPIGAGPHDVRLRAVAPDGGTLRPVLVEGVLDGDGATGVRVWDASHGGYGSTHYADQSGWRSSLAEVDPELVVIELGGNDYAFQLTGAQFEANLRTIVDGVRAAATGPVSIALLPIYNAEGRDPARYAPYVEAQRRLAAEQGLALIDLSQTDASLLTDDGIHPHTAGQRVFATNVLAAAHPGYDEPLVPAAATDLVVTAGATAGTLSAAWTPVLGATSYVVRLVDAAGSVISETTQDATTAAFTGLSAGTAHTVLVFAGSGAGFSTVTSASASTAGAPVVVPKAPTGVVATHDASTGAVRVTWTAPAGPVTDYSVLVYDTVSGYRSDLTVTTASATLTGLPAGRSYIFGVYARNSAGYSPGVASNVVAVPVKLVVPAAPTSVVASYVSSTDVVRVSWKAPVGAVTEYLVQVFDAVSGYRSSLTTTALAVNVAGLPSGRSYILAVYARNAAGYSPAAGSNTVVVPVKLVAPAAPTNVVAATTSAAGTVRVSWTASAGTVTSYVVVARDTSSGALTTKTFTSSPATFTGLVKGRTYVFTVQAVNAAGTSAPAASNAVKITR